MSRPFLRPGCHFKRVGQAPLASRQSGQALFMGLVLLGACLIALAASWSIGQLVHDQYSLRRGADAAVYSAAVAQARALNLHAYLNRAQIAHLVAMKHLVVLASAEKFRATQATRSTRFNPPAMLIGGLFGPQYGSAYQASTMGGTSATTGLKVLQDAFEHHDETVRSVLERARLDLLKHHVAIRQDNLESILVRNVGQSGSTMQGRTLADLGLTVQVSRNDLGGRVKALTTRNREWQSMLKQAFEPYRYLSERDFISRSYWAINVRCPHMQNELRRRGSVSYDSNGVWDSKDTLSYHAVRYNKFIGCYHREYPMGWAFLRSNMRSVPTKEESIAYPENFSNQSFWRWVSSSGISNWNIFSGSENWLATGWSYMDSTRWTSSGSRHFGSLTGDLSKPLKLGVRVRQSASRLKPRPEIKEISVTSMAETHYSRPQNRRDGRQELPSLFHPYWQARLSQED